jgi:hypothetical protein
MCTTTLSTAALNKAVLHSQTVATWHHAVWFGLSFAHACPQPKTVIRFITCPQHKVF